MVRRTSTLLAAALLATVTGYSTNSANADNVYPHNTSARIIRAGDTTGRHVVREVQLHSGNSRRGIYVVHHSYEDRVITKAKARNASSSASLIHVRTYGTNVYLRPDGDYHRQQGRYNASAKYHLPVARSIGKYLQDGKARIIWGGPELAPMSEVSDISPLMIINRPNNVRPKSKAPDAPKKDTAPLVASAK